MYTITILFLAFLFSGCATITDGTTQEMSFQATPEDVVVTIIRQVPGPAYWTKKDREGRPKPPTMHEERRVLGKTPFTLQLDRAEGQSVMFSRDGYKPITMELTTQTNSAFWGNIIAGGLFGSTTDNVSGAIYQYVPNQYLVTLIPEHATTIEQSAGQPQRDKALAFIVRRYPDIIGNNILDSGRWEIVDRYGGPRFRILFLACVLARLRKRGLRNREDGTHGSLQSLKRSLIRPVRLCRLRRDAFGHVLLRLAVSCQRRPSVRCTLAHGASHV